MLLAAAYLAYADDKLHTGMFAHYAVQSFDTSLGHCRQCFHGDMSAASDRSFARKPAETDGGCKDEKQRLQVREMCLLEPMFAQLSLFGYTDNVGFCRTAGAPLTFTVCIGIFCLLAVTGSIIGFVCQSMSS